MTWQLRDPAFRRAIRSLVDAVGEACALVGTVGVQIHLARSIGIDKIGPPAHAIELVLLNGAKAPESVLGVPVRIVDALGFEASVRAGCALVEVAGEHYPVAAPEHIVGLILSAPELLPDAKWASFVLMRTCAGYLDFEEARGFLKRSGDPERQALLAELAYLAA